MLQSCLQEPLRHLEKTEIFIPTKENLKEEIKRRVRQSIALSRSHDERFENEFKDIQIQWKVGVAITGERLGIGIRDLENQELSFDVCNTAVIYTSLIYFRKSYVEVAKYLNQLGYQTSAAKIRRFWNSNDLWNKRVRAAKAWKLNEENLLPLSEFQKRSLETFMSKYQHCYVEPALERGASLLQKTFLLKEKCSFGRAYIHSILDEATKELFVMISSEKSSGTSATLLNFVARYFQEKNISVKRVITTNAAEFSYEYVLTTERFNLKHIKFKNDWMNQLGDLTSEYLKVSDILHGLIDKKNYQTIEDLRSGVEGELLHLGAIGQDFVRYKKEEDEIFKAKFGMIRSC